jgi:hypothetical protein
MALTAEQRKKIQTQMRRQLQQIAARRGAMKKAGPKGSTTHKNVGSTKGSKYRGTMAGLGYNAEELKYAKEYRKKYKESGSQKKDYKSAFKLGHSGKITNNSALTPAGAKKDRMKSIKQGGTVGKGTHSSGKARTEAKDWRKKNVDSLKKKYKIGAGSTAAQRKSYKESRAKVINRHKRMIGN